MKFDDKYFKEFAHSKIAVQKYLGSAYKDLEIARNADIADVIFQFSYNALIKLGISMIASRGYKVNSKSGHHIKIIDALAEILNDEDIAVFGNSMRKFRNTELYDGGILVSKKQADEYLEFVDKTFDRSADIFKKYLGRLM